MTCFILVKNGKIKIAMYMNLSTIVQKGRLTMALPSPEQLSKGNSEHAHQCAVFAWAAQNESKWPELKWLHAIPNGGSRGDNAQSAGAVGAFMKAEGVRSGIVDINLPAARGGYFGFYLEMKKPGKLNTTSKKQKEFISYARANGYAVGIADNWQDAVKWIQTYLEMKPTKVN